MTEAPVARAPLRECGKQPGLTDTSYTVKVGDAGTGFIKCLQQSIHLLFAPDKGPASLLDEKVRQVLVHSSPQMATV